MSKGPCSVEGCEKQIDRRGYCRAHRRRLERHGDPLGGGLAYGETMKFVETVALPYSGDDCLLWPHGHDGRGYGSIYFRGKHTRAHRVVCILAHGEPDGPTLQAAHSCGNGQGGCVNPRHLRWATPSGNCQDKYAHGTMPIAERSGAAKVTAEQVLEIRELAGKGESCTSLGRRFGISSSQATAIVAKKKWKWLSSRNDLPGIAALMAKQAAENERIDREGRAHGT